MNPKERFNLIKRNTEEILTEEELLNLVKTKKKPRAYIGLAVTGKVHIGYFIPMIKVADFLKAGFHFVILLADMHAHLDDRKAPFELLDKRVKYYKEAMTGMIKALKIDTKNLEFIRGSDFELKRDYTLDMYKLAALNTFERCKRAAAEVVRFGEHPKLSGFLYPLLQTLDEQYMGMDVQYGGVDQRKILAFARESHPKLGYKPRIEVMTPMLPGLTGGKMSASEKASKIDITEKQEDVKKKLLGAYCPEGKIEENGVLAFLKHVVMVYKQDNKKEFIVERPKKFGGDVSYSIYEELERDYIREKLHPQDLKLALVDEVNALLEPIRKQFKGKEKLIKNAFPDD